MKLLIFLMFILVTKKDIIQYLIFMIRIYKQEANITLRGLRKPDLKLEF